jgi:SAM-dependent methyltransferase
VDDYHLRPLYPEETFSVLAGLVDPVCQRVLDVGCGTGEIARRIAPYVEQVDAVDLSAAMIARGKRRTGGDAHNLNWIEGEVESVALSPPYGLITAAASLHWMDWSIVLPRFAEVLTPEGVLAILSEDSPAVANMEAFWKLMPDYWTFPEYQPFDVIEVLTQRGLFTIEGEHWTAPVAWEQSIADYIGSFHARTGFSRDRMGAAASQAFDTAAAQILWTICPEGSIPMNMRTRVVWGRPTRAETSEW